MFLSKLFKRKSTKLLTLFGALTMALGVGAAASVVVSEQQNEVVETKADNTHTVYFVDEAWWRTDVVGVFLYAWDSETVESESGVVHNASWPGVAMTPPESPSASGGNKYYSTVDTDKFDRMIVSRTNASGVDAQTVDITISDSALDTNDTYSIAGTSAAWIGQGNKVTGFWTDSEKSDWYLVGEGSFVTGETWSTGGGVRMKKNPNNPNDKGMLIHQKLTAGDIFKIRNGSDWKGSNDYDDASIKYPVFETYHNSHLMHYVYLQDNNPASNADGTYGSAVENASATDIYIQCEISWYTDDGYVPGIKTDNDDLIAGTYVNSSGSYKQYRVQVNPKEYSSYVIGRVKGSSFLNQASGTYNTSSLSSGKDDIYVSKTGYYDIYLTGNGKIFVRNSFDESKGYLYISQKNASGVAFTDNSGSPYFHAWYVAKNGTEYGLTGDWGSRTFADCYYGFTENLSFNSKSGLYRLPLSIFNGASKFNLYSYGGGSTKWQTGDSDVPTGTAPLYCLPASGSGISTDATNGKAAEAAYEIERAIAGAKNQTLCELTVAQAGTLVSYYSAASTASSSGLHTTATVTTYTPTNNQYKDGVVKIKTPLEPVQLSKIYSELYARATTGKWTAKLVPGTVKDSESPLTTTLWIVLASGLAGLAAIGTAYFVSKKKRHQA